MSQPRLLSVSAFYKNDQPDGIGIQLVRESLPSLNLFVIEVTSAYRLMWRAAVIDGYQHRLVRDSLSRLDAIGKADKREPVSDADIVATIGNVWLLEQIGAIRSDEYNGMMYASEGGPYTPPRLR